MAVMAEYFLFFRCWPGFSDPFPFERFNALPDDELPSALEVFARERLREERKRIKEVARGRRREFANTINAMKRQSRMRMGIGQALPACKSGHQVISLRQRRWERVRRADRKDPLVCRLGAYLGWCTDKKVNGPAVWFPAVWFCLSAYLALAGHLVKELNRQQCLDYDKHQLEHHANPRFGFVPADGLSLGQRASIQRCINAIQEGGKPAVQDAQLALIIGQKALAVALDVAKAWPIDEDKELLAALPAPLAADEDERQAAQETETPEGPEGKTAGDGGGEVEVRSPAVSEPKAEPSFLSQNGSPARQDPPNPRAGQVCLNATEAARYIGVNDSTIRRWIRDHRIGIFGEEGVKYWFSRSELDAHREVQTKKKAKRSNTSH